MEGEFIEAGNKFKEANNQVEDTKRAVAGATAALNEKAAVLPWKRLKIGILNLYILLTSHGKTTAGLGYTYAVVLGAMYEAVFYYPYGINIFEYSTSSDFLLSGSKLIAFPFTCLLVTSFLIFFPYWIISLFARLEISVYEEYMAAIFPRFVNRLPVNTFLAVTFVLLSLIVTVVAGSFHSWYVSKRSTSASIVTAQPLQQTSKLVRIGSNSTYTFFERPDTNGAVPWDWLIWEIFDRKNQRSASQNDAASASSEGTHTDDVISRNEAISNPSEDTNISGVIPSGNTNTNDPFSSANTSGTSPVAVLAVPISQLVCVSEDTEDRKGCASYTPYAGGSNGSPNDDKEMLKRMAEIEREHATLREEHQKFLANHEREGRAKEFEELRRKIDLYDSRIGTIEDDIQQLQGGVAQLGTEHDRLAQLIGSIKSPPDYTQHWNELTNAIKEGGMSKKRWEALLEAIEIIKKELERGEALRTAIAEIAKKTNDLRSESQTHFNRQEHILERNVLERFVDFFRGVDDLPPMETKYEK